jgi:hypothetical protein
VNGLKSAYDRGKVSLSLHLVLCDRLLVTMRWKSMVIE